MDERVRKNYLLIIIILLLVVAIITGAGLCYLSWSDESTTDKGNVGSSTEQTVISKPEQPTEDNAVAVKPTEPATEAESTETEAVTEEEMLPERVTMEHIQVTEDGEYYYMRDGTIVSQKGIDVSKYQGDIDWKKVAGDGVTYAFVRVGCRGYGGKGTLIKDEKFHQNVKGALEQGIEVGAYFFTQAVTEQEALEEAELVIKELEGYDITYPVAIDVEHVKNDKARQDALTAEERTALCRIFCEKIKEAGYIPMIYGDNATFTELLLTDELAEYDFWICETDGKQTFPYAFAVWQYSHEGKIDGIKNDTNVSVCVKQW